MTLTEKLIFLAGQARKDAALAASRGDAIGASHAKGLANGYATAAMFAQTEVDR